MIKQKSFSFPIYGDVGFENDDAKGVAVNLLVKVGEEWHPINNDDGFIIRDEHGFGFINQLASGTKVKIIVDIPHGYEVDPASDYIPGTEYTIDESQTWDVGGIGLRRKKLYMELNEVRI